MRSLEQIGSDIVAIDTASSNGSARRSGPFETAVLADEDAVLLEEVLAVEWKYRRPVSA